METKQSLEVGRNSSSACKLHTPRQSTTMQSAFSTLNCSHRVSVSGNRFRARGLCELQLALLPVQNVYGERERERERERESMEKEAFGQCYAALPFEECLSGASERQRELWPKSTHWTESGKSSSESLHVLEGIHRDSL